MICTDTKRALAHEWAGAGLSQSEIARRLNCSRQYIKKLLAQPAEFDTTTDDDGADDITANTSERLLRARCAVLEAQSKRLERQLAIESGQLIRADYLDKILLAFLKHYEAQTDWLRQNRMGDTELLEAHLASVKGAQRECHNQGYVEGSNIDAD